MANKSKTKRVKKSGEKFPAQSQKKQPGLEWKMDPNPEYLRPNYKGANKLQGKVALITGGDSGIGRAVAVAYVLEGAKVAINYLSEKDDAEQTLKLIEEFGGEGLLIKGDVGKKSVCKTIISKVKSRFGSLDILVNNAAEQHPEAEFEKISEKNLEKTFKTNIFSMVYLCQEALPLLKKSESGVIINTTSVTAYRGSPALIDYSATKGAIVSFTRSLSQNLIQYNIRVNAVAPGPIWTPLIPATFKSKKVEKFGSDVPMGRAGQPSECAPAYVFLASLDSSYTTGQVLHVNGGEIING